MADRRLVETAYHEAGHAVASIDLGFRFTEAVIKQDGSGHVGPGVRLPRHWGHHFSPHGRERAEDQIVMFAAGPVSEARLTGRRVDVLRQSQIPRSDWSNIQFRYEALRPDSELEWLMQRSRVLVARRWREIEFVATALVDASQLTADEVVEQIAHAYSGRPSGAAGASQTSTPDDDGAA